MLVLYSVQLVYETCILYNAQFQLCMYGATVEDSLEKVALSYCYVLQATRGYLQKTSILIGKFVWVNVSTCLEYSIFWQHLQLE